MLHLAHGRHLVIERVNNAPSAPFPRELREPWWPVPPTDTSEKSWQADLALLDDYQANCSTPCATRLPRSSIACLPAPTTLCTISCSAWRSHDAYHAGQIRLLTLMT